MQPSDQTSDLVEIDHWRNIMHSKDEQIRALQHSNGQGVSIIHHVISVLQNKLLFIFYVFLGYLMSVPIL